MKTNILIKVLRDEAEAICSRLSHAPMELTVAYTLVSLAYRLEIMEEGWPDYFTQSGEEAKTVFNE